MSNNIWWVGQSDLDEDQIEAFSGRPDQSALVTGPPGSGKTNLLLLRAAYLEKSGTPHLKLLVFSKLLRAFLRFGASTYSINLDNIETSQNFIRKKARELLTAEEFQECDAGRDMVESRQKFAQKLAEEKYINEIDSLYDCILLDEVQDYTADEIKLLGTMAKTVFAAGDENQSIYRNRGAIDEIKKLEPVVHTLRHHYRNGISICRIAEALTEKRLNPVEIVKYSKYDETQDKSGVALTENIDLESQLNDAIENIEKLIIAYPNDFHAILAPKRETLSKVLSILKDSKIAHLLWSENDDLSLDKPIIATTAHSAKGLEFRSTFVIAAEELVLFRGKCRSLAFTSFTRAKTKLHVYFSDKASEYYRSASSRAFDGPGEVDINDLFPPQR